MTEKYTFRNWNNKLLQITRGNGIYLYTKEKKILDTTGGGTSFAVLGWNNKIINKSILKQLKKFHHIDYKVFKDDNIEKLSKLLLSKAEHKLNSVYFSGSSGGEACEAAMKMSYLKHCADGNSSKVWFIGRNQSYHGVGTDALSIAERPNMNIYKPLFPIKRSRIEQHHYMKERLKGETEEEYAIRSSNLLEKEILRIGPEKVSAFIGETIMGGLVGDVPPVKNYWKYIRKICDKYNVHLILDECYCGLGASGKIYCCDYDKVTPDFIFVGKTLTAGHIPLSAVITKRKFRQKIIKKFSRVLHSTTFQGHSLGISAALSAQKIIHQKNMLQNINNNGNYLKKVLLDELKNHDFFFDVRGRGLRLSFEYNCNNKNKFGNILSNKMLEKYNILINAKWHRVCLTPAYIITKSQCDFVLDKLIKEFKNLSNSWK
jgi:adenosylmethionine-8-amino-7-oxononanoate aminotransferase